MRQLFSRVPALLCVVGLVVGLAAPFAVAAPVSLEESVVFVQLYPEEQPGLASMVAYTQIPADAELPATVRLPIPQGAEPFWVGEVYGSAINNDIDQEREYEIKEGDGGSFIEFTLEETRTALYEATTGPLDVVGGRYAAEWTWVESVPLGDTQFSVTLPPNATLVQIRPVPIQTPTFAEGGRQMFFLSPSRLESGETTSVGVRYSRAQVDLPEVGSGSGGFPALTVLFTLIGVAVLVLVVILLRERSLQQARVVHAEDDETDVPDDSE